MPTETRTAKPRRSLGLGALLCLLLIPAAVFFSSKQRNSMRADRPPSAAFRQYLSDRGSRLVVYSPEIGPDNNRHRVVEQQLVLLRNKFDGLVLYHCDEDTASILDSATSLGYRAVLLTVWDPNSVQEVKTAAWLVDRFQGRLAIAVSIGSEGLMEARYTLDQVASAARQLKLQSRGPQAVELTTAEPWWLYLKQDDEAVRLRDFGDFTSANIHVVWDADITDPAMAANWTADRAIEVQQHTQKLLLVREAGFPGGGQSPRISARLHFDRSMQAQFWTAWQARSAKSAIPPIAVFEAIDNPQKQWQSFEGEWGLLSTGLQPYPAWNAIPDLPRRWRF